MSSAAPSAPRDYNGVERAYISKRDRKFDDRITNKHSGPPNGYS